jgi:hypothetical protein
VTYAVAYEALGDVFPTKRPLLHGYVSHLLAYQYVDSTIIKHISAVVTRNKDYGHNVLGYGDLRRYTDAIKRVLVSRVQRTRFHLFPHHLQGIARLDGGSNHTRLRDACMIIVGTIGAYRKSELLEVDVCDWVEGRDRYGDTGDSLGAELTELCLVRKVRLYLDSAGLSVQPVCRKWAQPGGVDAIGADHRAYSKSMCRGGLSTAKRAGVCKTLRMTQSGHRSKAHAVYESDSSSGEDAVGVSRTMPRGGWRVEDLYHFSREFGL